MAITRNTVMDMMDSVDLIFTLLIEDEIDCKLSSPEWVANWACGEKDNKYFNFSFPGHLSQKTKEKIIQIYMDAGWGKVECTNSEEQGERPGMCRVTLYMNEGQ